MSTATNENKLRHHAEQQFAEELEELKKICRQDVPL